MKQTLSTISFFALAVALCSCSKKDSSTNNSNAPAGFLTEGHRLVYRIVPNAFYPDTLYTVTYSKSNTTNIFTESDTSSNRVLTPGYQTYLRFENGKLYFSDNLNSATTTSNYSVDFNAALNSFWVISQSGFSNHTIRVVGKNVQTTVLCGTFSCTLFSSGRDTSYFNQEIGEVKHASPNIAYDLISKNF